MITQRGIEVLKGSPKKIDVKFLEQFPEFVEFRTAKKDSTSTTVKGANDAQTPEETIEYSYQGLRKALAQDLLGKVVALSPSLFEKLVDKALLVKWDMADPSKMREKR